MKLPSLLLALGLAVHPITAAEPPKPAEPRSPRLLLQEALFAEEAERDLDKASAGYTEMLAQFETQRALAATALYHLAEIRAKQKKAAEAIALHQRLVAEFPKEEALAKLSRERLAALGAAAPEAGATGAGAVLSEEAKELARVQKIVKDSPDLLNAEDENGHAPIIRAGLAGWVEVSAFLLDHGVNIDGKDGAWVPLHAAARGGHKRLVELLLSRGADVNATARGGGWTALHSAANHNRVEVARLLLERGAKPDVVARDFSRFEGKEATPLLLAIEKEQKEMARLLLEKGADPSLANPATHQTPLTSALWEDQQDIFDLLLEKGAKVDAQGAGGYSALTLAAKFERLAAAKALLARKARVDLADNDGITALHYAAASSAPMVELLLAAGASPKAVTKGGLTPLHFTLKDGFQSVQRMPALASSQVQKRLAALPKIWDALLAQGGEINAVDAQGFTLLTYACGSSDLPAGVVLQLVQRGADPDVKSNDGHRPLRFANPPRRDELERAIVFPKLAKQRAVSVLDRWAGGFEDPQMYKAPGLDAEPGAWSEILHSVIMGPARPMTLTVYRADARGEIKEAGSSEGKSSANTESLPKPKWGDIVVISTEKEARQRARVVPAR